MIIVKVELHSAVTGQVQTLGLMRIANDGTGGTKKGNYDCHVAHKRDAVKHQIGRPARTGKVRDYPRLSYNVWRLVARALKSAFPEEK